MNKLERAFSNNCKIESIEYCSVKIVTSYKIKYTPNV